MENNNNKLTRHEAMLIAARYGIEHKKFCTTELEYQYDILSQIYSSAYEGRRWTHINIDFIYGTIGNSKQEIVDWLLSLGYDVRDASSQDDHGLVVTWKDIP